VGEIQTQHGFLPAQEVIPANGVNEGFADGGSSV
jgi:hypothetical protein